MIKRWYLSVFTLELRQVINYRADFWVNFVGSTGISFIIAYFLWRAVFESLSVSTLNGFTMDNMIFYYLIAPQIFRIQQGSGIGNISREIYDGSLNKYLLIQLTFFNIKHVSILLIQLSTSFNFFLILTGYKIYIGFDTALPFSIYNFILFIFAMYFCAILYFAMSALSELTAFWADNIWSLGVIIRFLTSFLGGALIPLSFFPGWANEILSFTPFPYLVSFPVSILSKNISLESYLENLGILILWIFFFIFMARFIWHRGKYKYTGVGI
jgi:ABC-2 type transport system permease protein